MTFQVPGWSCDRETDRWQEPTLAEAMEETKMDDMLAIVGIAAMVASAAGFAIGLRWILGRGDAWAFADTLLTSNTPDWPVGVQEEEPFRWPVGVLRHTPRGRDGETGRTSPRVPAPQLPRAATLRG
jgi:hypothetical protein